MVETITKEAVQSCVGGGLVGDLDQKYAKAIVNTAICLFLPVYNIKHHFNDGDGYKAFSAWHL